jgi:hypothetical protein
MEPFMATIVGIGLLFYVAIPSFIISFIFARVLQFRPTWRFLKIGHDCRIIAVAIILCLPAIPISMVISDYRIEATKQYCEKLIPRLEQWRQQNGGYPLLSEIGGANPPRWLLDFDYSTSDGLYSFSITDPAAFMNIWLYDSDERQWVREG